MQYPTVDRVMDPMEMTARLAKMSSDQLRMYAQMHSDDANVVALALAESKRRQALKPQPQLQQQPTVLEQTLGQMGEQVELPEDVGIGQLPARNISNMAGGGIVAFAEGDKVDEKLTPQQKFARKYQAAAERAAQQLDVDPGIIIAHWGHEMGWKDSKAGKNNLGNIKDFSKSGSGTRAYDKDEKSNDRYRNYETPEDFADDYVLQIKKNWPEAVGTGGDARKFISGLRAGEQGGYATDTGYSDKMRGAISQAYKYMPVGTASANAATSAPAKAQPQASGNPFSGEDTVYDPVTGLPMYGPQTTVPDEDLTLRERMGLGNRANRKVLEAMEEAERLKKTGAKMTPAESKADVESLLRRHPAPPVQPQHPSSAYDPTGMWDEQNAAASAPDAPQTAAEKSWLDRMSGDDWMNLGLSLLKSRSPHWQVAAGEAGEAMMAGKRAAEKAALEKEKVTNEAAYRDKYINAISQKDETAGQRIALEALSKAAKNAEDELATIAKSPEGIMALQDPVAWERKKAEIEAKHLRNAQRYVKTITGKEYDFGDIGGGPSRADFTLNPGKGLVPNR